MALQAGSCVDDDYLTVTMLAVGLAQIMRRRSGGGQGDGLLPGPWRVAFSRLWWRCLEEGVAALDNDLDLLALCTQPFAVWPVSLRLSPADLEECLLADGELSIFAEECARLAPGDVEAEWQENRVYEALRVAAHANGDGDPGKTDLVYSVLRRRLIDYPVVSDRDVLSWEGEFNRTDGSGQTYVRHLVNEAYVARPQAGVFRYWRCPSCRNTVAGRAAACGTPGCAPQPGESVTVRTLAVIYEQHRATRRFIHDPGLVEARILDALADPKLEGRIRVTPYPVLDTLDILIEFLSGGDGEPVVEEAWGADAKDQASARILGRGFTWPDGEPQCSRRLLVLPAHRWEEPGYVAALGAELDGRVRDVEVIAEKQLIAQVHKRARKAGGSR
jgi:hypothetical protein